MIATWDDFILKRMWPVMQVSLSSGRSVQNINSTYIYIEIIMIFYRTKRRGESLGTRLAFMNMYKDVNLCMHACTHTHTCTHAHAHMHTHTHTHTHTYTHTHTHTLTHTLTHRTLPC